MIYSNLKPIIISLVLLLAGVNLNAQVPDLVEGEYFFDLDPGFGNGTALIFTPDTIIDENFSIPITGLSEGAHKLYVRTKDASGKWSHAYVHQFYVEDLLVLEPAPLLVEGEFFFDTDPGWGNGHPLTVSMDSVVDFTQAIQVDTLSLGVHKLYVRIKDDHGRWSHCYIHQFDVEDLLVNEPKPLLVEAEYFFDTDPGFGSGHPIAINNDSIIDELESLPVDTLPEGVHKLYVRTKDDSGRWSHVYIHQFDKEDRLVNEVAPDIIKFEYYFDSVYTTMGDPGYGGGVQLPTVQMPLVDTTFYLDVSGLVDTGHYYVFFRAFADSTRRWSLNNWHSFVKVPPLSCSGIMSSYTCGYEVSCNAGSDGSIDVTAAGGSGGYTFAWNDGPTTEDRTGLTAGTYTVIVTDFSGLMDTCTYVLTEPNPIACNDSIPLFGCGFEISCSGATDGSIDLSPTGGCPPYTFSWSDGPTTEDRNTLGAGTYSVTITDQNGCTKTCSYTLNQPMTLSCTGVISQYGCNNDVSCDGDMDGTITLTVTGGCAPFTYSWNDGPTTKDRSGLGAGMYTVTVTDTNGCTTTCSFTLNDPLPLVTSGVISQFTCDNISCAGAQDGSIDFSVSGGCAPYTYQWGDGPVTEDRMNLGPGMYYVTATDFNGCVAIDSFSLSEPDTLTCSGGMSTYTCNYNVSSAGAMDGSIDLSVQDGCPGYSYQWSDGPTTEDRTNLGVGTYTVTVTDQNGCTTECSFTLVGPNSAFTVTGNLSNFNCGYNISCNGAEDGSINLSVTGGCQPFIYNWSDGDTSSSRSNLGPGQYIVTVTDQNGLTDVGIYALSEPQPLSFFKSTSQFACNSEISCAGAEDGNINLTVFGGCGPYMFSWNDGYTLEDRSSLSAGQYIVTITDQNGCSVLDTTILTEPDELVMNASLSQFMCNANVSCTDSADGAIDLTILGGCPPYTISWSDGSITEDRTNLSGGTYSVTITDQNGCAVVDTFILNEPQPVVISGVTSTYSCGYEISCYDGSDGSIDLNISGGCSSYSILWNDGNTNEDRTQLSAGSYTVSVTDQNGCFHTESFTLSEPDSLSISYTSSLFACGYNVTCTGASDGSIDLTVAHGCGPYTYQWDDGNNQEDRSGLSAGTYQVTVTDQNGCVQSAIILLSEPSALTIGSSISQYQCGTAVSCHGAMDGSIDVSMSGGCAPYIYQWSDGSSIEDRSGLGAGVYYLTVTDANGCVASDSFVLVEPAALAVADTVSTYSCGNQISCAGGQDGRIDLTVSGGCGPYTFSWGDGVQTEDRFALTAGTYDVTITDANGCELNRSYILTEPTPLTVSSVISQFGCNNNISCAGADDGSIDLTVSGGCGSFTYAWSDGGTTEDRSGLGGGTYGVTITDQNGCIGTQSFTLTEPTSIAITADVSEYECGYGVSCYGAGDGSIDLAVSGGCAGYSYLWSDGSSAGSRTGLSAGVYYITVTDQNGCIEVDSFSITSPDELELNITTMENCEGHDLVAIPTGGCAPFSYEWSTGDTTARLANVSTGSYAVTVTDANGCFTNTLETVATSINPINCAISILTDPLRCEQTGYLQVDVTGGTGPYSYNWTIISSGVSWSITEGQDSSIVGVLSDQEGDSLRITVSVMDVNECEAICEKLVTCDAIGLQQEFVIWPNPTNEELNVKYTEPGFTGEVEFEMYDVLGRRVMNITKTMDEELLTKINVIRYAQGNYILRLQRAGTGEWITRKVMVIR